MLSSRLTALALALALVLTTVVAGAGVAAATNNTTTTEEEGILDNDGDGSIVDDVTPDFLGDLMQSLPVPEFVADKFV